MFEEMTNASVLSEKKPPLVGIISHQPEGFSKKYYILKAIWDHPLFACFRGGGVKNLPNLRMDSTKKMPTVGS